MSMAMESNDGDRHLATQWALDANIDPGGSMLAAREYASYQTWKDEPVGEPVLSVVIPTYNEEIRIIPTIGAMASHISGIGLPWELIIADDGSKDSTVAEVEALGFANLKLLPAPKNGGKGSAVQRGMIASRGAYVLFADADNSTPIEEISLLLTKVQDEGFDVAVGSRAALGANVEHKSWKRRILSAGLHTLVRAGLRIGVQDTQCGFKLFTRDAAHRLFGAQTIMGFSFDLEILFLARRYGFRVAEVPVQWIDAPGSKVNARKEVRRFVQDIWRIRLNSLRGVYLLELEK